MSQDDHAARRARHQRYEASAEMAARLTLPPAAPSCAYCGQRWDDAAGGCDAAVLGAALEEAEALRVQEQKIHAKVEMELGQARQAAEARAAAAEAKIARLENLVQQVGRALVVEDARHAPEVEPEPTRVVPGVQETWCGVCPHCGVTFVITRHPGEDRLEPGFQRHCSYCGRRLTLQADTVKP